MDTIHASYIYISAICLIRSNQCSINILGLLMVHATLPLNEFSRVNSANIGFSMQLYVVVCNMSFSQEQEVGNVSVQVEKHSKYVVQYLGRCCSYHTRIRISLRKSM